MGHKEVLKLKAAIVNLGKQNGLSFEKINADIEDKLSNPYCDPALELRELLVEYTKKS